MNRLLIFLLVESSAETRIRARNWEWGVGRGLDEKWVPTGGLEV